MKNQVFIQLVVGERRHFGVLSSWVFGLMYRISFNIFQGTAHSNFTIKVIEMDFTFTVV